MKFEKIMAQTILNFESSLYLTDVSAAMYDRKTAARPFYTIHDVLRYLSLVQSLLKPEIRQTAGTNAYEPVGNRRV